MVGRARSRAPRLKTLALIARKPGLSREEFRAHYEEVHAPLALPLLRGLVRYVRHYVTEELHGAPGFDVITSFTYRDAAAARAVMAKLATAAGDPIRADELTFMDKPRNRFFEAREVSETGARDRAAPLQCAALVKRVAGEGAAQFAADFAERALPALRNAARGLRWCLHSAALDSFGEPPFDAVVQLHAEADAGLARWVASLETRGARVAIVRVAERETALPSERAPA